MLALFPDSLYVTAQMISGSLHMHRVLVELAKHHGTLECGNKDSGASSCINLSTNLLPFYPLRDDALDGGTQAVHGSTGAVP